jgi:hypothetical protein
MPHSATYAVASVNQLLGQGVREVEGPGKSSTNPPGERQSNSRFLHSRKVDCLGKELFEAVNERINRCGYEVEPDNTDTNSVFYELSNPFLDSCIIDQSIPGESIRLRSSGFQLGSAGFQLGNCSFLNIRPDQPSPSQISAELQDCRPHFRVEVGEDCRLRFMITFWGDIHRLDRRGTQLGFASTIDLTRAIRQFAVAEYSCSTGVFWEADLGEEVKIAPTKQWADRRHEEHPEFLGISLERLEN